MLIDNIYKDIIRNLLDNGEWRDTRNGRCLSAFDYNFKIDLQKEFPLLTLKKTFPKVMLGELIFFITACGNNGVNLEYLRECTFGRDNTRDENGNPKWTIWTDDQNKWYTKYGELVAEGINDNKESLGFLPYAMALCTLDEIIDEIKANPNSRRLIINYMPSNTILKETYMYPLPPCHYSVQFYVSKGKVNCKYIMRSNDIGLGFPMNVSFYAFLTYIVASCTGLDVGTLSGSLGDYHIYENQLDMVNECLAREPLDDNGIHFTVSDLQLNRYYDLFKKTSLDFMHLFKDYKSYNAIKCKLLV